VPRVATWNVEWAGRGARGARIGEAIASFDVDVAVLTETSDHRALADGEAGGWVDAGGDWGYGEQRSRRKVAMWSRTGWTDVEVGSDGAEAGRIVVGRTTLAGRVVTVFGVCIPWRAAHVTTGRRDRAPWEEHRSFCVQLGARLRASGQPIVVAGDFNQRIPGGRQPDTVRAALAGALEGLDIVTVGVDSDLLNHIAVSSDLQCSATDMLDPCCDGLTLTDHLGAVATLRFAADHVSRPVGRSTA